MNVVLGFRDVPYREEPASETVVLPFLVIEWAVANLYTKEMA